MPRSRDQETTTPLIEPLTRWTCDDCGHDVSSTNGLLTFRNDPTEPFLAYEFRIMHTSGCQPDSDNTVTDELESYLGEDGLAALLAYLTAGPGQADEHGIAVRDMDEFVDLIRPTSNDQNLWMALGGVT